MAAPGLGAHMDPKMTSVFGTVSVSTTRIPGPICQLGKIRGSGSDFLVRRGHGGGEHPDLRARRRHRASPVPRFELGHLFDDIGGGQAGESRVFRAALPVRKVAHAAGPDLGRPAVLHHFRHRGVVIRKPVIGVEEIEQLCAGEGRVAPREGSLRPVIGRRFHARIEKRIGEGEFALCLLRRGRRKSPDGRGGEKCEEARSRNAVSRERSMRTRRRIEDSRTRSSARHLLGSMAVSSKGALLYRWLRRQGMKRRLGAGRRGRIQGRLEGLPPYAWWGPARVEFCGRGSTRAILWAKPHVEASAKVKRRRFTRSARSFPDVCPPSAA